MAFTVAVATLIIFGGTLPWVIRRLRFQPPSRRDHVEEILALLSSLSDSVREQLGPLAEQEVNGQRVAPEVAETVSRRFAPMLSGRRKEPTKEQMDARAQAMVLQQRYLDAFRHALAEELVVGGYSHEATTQVQRLLDAKEWRQDWAAG